MSKTIGILGGMTPESTTTYYQHITRSYVERFGNYSFPAIIVYSVSFQQYEDWMLAGEWNAIAEGLSKAVISLKNGGADFIVIATNTMHKVFHQIQKKSPIPLISIIDATAEEIHKRKMGTVGLLGTIFTMKESFYKDGLKKHGIRTLVPEAEDQDIVNQIIFDELGRGIFTKESRKQYVEIVRRLHERGAEGIILGCTEIPLLIKEEDCGIPLFDTAVIHAEKALQYALSDVE
jgi:aspartate racemase